jgi:hypothetical protein
MRITIHNDELVKKALIRETTRTKIAKIIDATKVNPEINHLITHALNHYGVIECPICHGIACHTVTLESMPPYTVYECRQGHQIEIQQDYDDDE